MAFQQELISIVDAYALRTIADFDRLPPTDKHYFVTRMFKCFERGLDNLADDLRAFGGLKLAYERPLSERRNLLEDTAFKKLALYSSHAVITCPIDSGSMVKTSKSKRIAGRERLDSATIRGLRDAGKYVFGDVKPHHRTHGGEIHVEGKAYIVDRSAVARLIETVIGLREALVHGLVHVVPAWPDAKPKLRADLRNSGVVSGNFSRPSLIQQFYEDAGHSRHLADAGVVSIYLPHLSNVPMMEIIDIRAREAVAYSAFQSALTKCVFTTDDGFSEQRLEGYLKELDDAIKQIRARHERLQRQYDSRNRGALLRLLAFSLVLIGPANIAALLLPVLSGYTAWDFANLRGEHKREVSSAVSEEFFIPWTLDVSSRTV